MKFSFQAIDGRGALREGTLRAESLEDAREALLEEELFPKTLTEAPEETKVTWTAQERVKRRLAERQASIKAEAAVEVAADAPRLETVMVRGRKATKGALAVAGVGRVAFVPSGGGEGAARLLQREDVEQVRVNGFPKRRLAVYLLDGDLLEFSAGFVLTHPVARLIAKTLAK